MTQAMFCGKQYKYFSLYAYLHCTKDWCRRNVCCIITKEIYLKLDDFRLWSHANVSIT